MAGAGDLQPVSNTVLGGDPAALEILRLKGEIALLRLIGELRGALREARDAESALRHVARSCADFFGADEAMVATSEPPYQRAEWLFTLPRDCGWNLPLLAEVIRGGKPAMPGNVMFARVKRRDRNWGALALRNRGGAEFSKADRQGLARVGQAVNELLAQVDAERIREVRDRIDRKIMDQLRPIDLAYQLLDGLRSLTRYDHSSAMLMNDGSGVTLELVAEQIAWRKAKSRRIGTRLGVAESLRRVLAEDTVYGFSATPDGWSEWNGRAEAAALADLLALRDEADAALAEAEMIVAPLRGRDGFLGVLKVSSRHAGGLGPYEAKLVSSFLPQASIAVQTAQRAEVLQSKMIAAERKHVLAELARAVAHDLNNALGSVLPLVQALRADAESGVLRNDTCRDDLTLVERAIQTCHRIFRRMLTFSRPVNSTVGAGQIRSACESTLAILGESLNRMGIRVEVTLADDLPEVRAGLNDLEQLLLNLVSNARDAMAECGGQLRIVASRDGSGLRLEVSDTGCGIPAELLPRLLNETFVTTKQHGTGLGLSICRSIVLEKRGLLDLRSRPGEGTTVIVILPASDGPGSEVETPGAGEVG